MRNIMILFFLFLSAVCYHGKAQLHSEMIDKIIKFRSDYIADSIPVKYKAWYSPFTYFGDKRFYNSYDTLKTVLSEISFNEKLFYWFESLATDRSSKNITLWSDNLVISFHCRYIATWDRVHYEDSIQYNLEIGDKLKRSSTMEPFLKDFEEWNENVTNRSYIGGFSAGGAFIFCSKVIIVLDQIEIMHTVFKNYSKEHYPLFWLKEKPEDNYAPRLQANCDWIINGGNEKVVWNLIEVNIDRGYKVFDCEGYEIEFEYEEHPWNYGSDRGYSPNPLKDRRIQSVNPQFPQRINPIIFPHR